MKYLHDLVKKQCSHDGQVDSFCDVRNALPDYLD